MRTTTVFLWVAIFFMLFSTLGITCAEAGSCPSCSDGFVDCSGCDGTGKVTMTCGDCTGGHPDCNTCRGSGTVHESCNNCSETGRVVCWTCKGTGNV